MKLSMIVTPFSRENLRKAAQVGVEEIVSVYPGRGVEPLLEAKRQVEDCGMRLTHIERKVPHHAIVHGLPGRDSQVEAVKALIRDHGDRSRTDALVIERGAPFGFPADRKERMARTSSKKGKSK